MIACHHTQVFLMSDGRYVDSYFRESLKDYFGRERLKSVMNDHRRLGCRGNVVFYPVASESVFSRGCKSKCCLFRHRSSWWIINFGPDLSRLDTEEITAVLSLAWVIGHAHAKEPRASGQCVIWAAPAGSFSEAVERTGVVLRLEFGFDKGFECKTSKCLNLGQGFPVPELVCYP